MPSIEAMSFTRACLCIAGGRSEATPEAPRISIHASTSTPQPSIFSNPIRVFPSLISTFMLPPLKDQYLLQQPDQNILAVSIVVDNSLAPHLELKAGDS